MMLKCTLRRSRPPWLPPFGLHFGGHGCAASGRRVTPPFRWRRHRQASLLVSQPGVGGGGAGRGGDRVGPQLDHRGKPPGTGAPCPGTAGPWPGPSEVTTCTSSSGNRPAPHAHAQSTPSARARHGRLRSRGLCVLKVKVCVEDLQKELPLTGRDGGDVGSGVGGEQALLPVVDVEVPILVRWGRHAWLPRATRPPPPRSAYPRISSHLTPCGS
jgi:hypothetical protein